MRHALAVFAGSTLMIAASAAHAHDAPLRVVLSGTDNPTPLEEYGVARVGGYVALSRDGRITATANLSQGSPGSGSAPDSSALVVATPRMDGDDFDFSLIARDGQLIGGPQDVTLGSISSDLRDVGFDGEWALFQSVLPSGLRVLYGGAGTMELFSTGGEQCPGQPAGILQQGGDGDVRVNSAGDIAFADCGGFNVNGTIVSFTNPPQGATGSFQGGSGPFIRALDDDGGLWVAGSTTCDACDGGAMHGLWRIDESGPVLAFDSSAHSQTAAIVRTTFPSLDGNGDFAALAFVGPPGASVAANTVIKVASGAVTVIARVGDEAADRPGRPITSVVAHPGGATGAYLDDGGTVVFLADVDNPPGRGLFRSSGGTIETVVMTGDVVDELFSGSTVTSLDSGQLAVSRTGHLAIAGTVERQGTLTSATVLFLDADGGGVRCGLAQGQLFERVVGADPEPIGSFFSPLVPARNDPLFLGNGTSADGFSDGISDDGLVLAKVQTQMGEALVLVGGGAPVDPPDLDLTVSGPTAPIQEQTSFVLQATVTPDGPGTLGSGSVELILQAGDVRIAELPAGCESDEDGIGNFTSVSCSRDFDAVPQTEVSFFVIGPEAIEFFVHATSPYGEDTDEFRATTVPAGADLAVSQSAPGSSMVLIENSGPVIAVGVVVELSDYTGSGEAAERISVGSIEVGGSATVDTLVNDDGRPFEITARVQSEIVDNDSTNNTAVLVRDDEHAEGCGCVALPAGETPGAGFVAIGLAALAAGGRRRRREHVGG
jgi:hypothetical protein